MAGNKRIVPATFFLTRRAAIDLRNIHARSCREWGETLADSYLADLYAVPKGIAVLTIQHQVRDIESLIADLAPAFHVEIKRLKRKHDEWL